MPSINLVGSNSVYPFHLYELTEFFSDIPVVYTFIRDHLIFRNLEVLYIGQTGNLAERLLNHHKLEEAKKIGASKIGLYHVASENQRYFIEKDLINNYKPPLNE